jgi:hypothetical protein
LKFIDFNPMQYSSSLMRVDFVSMRINFGSKHIDFTSIRVDFSPIRYGNERMPIDLGAKPSEGKAMLIFA